MSASGPMEPADRQGIRRPKSLAAIVAAAALVSAVVSSVGTYVALIVADAPQAQSARASAGSPDLRPVSLTQSEAIMRVALQVKPSVVTIMATGVSGVTPFSVPSSGAGSGFVVSSDGLILTNNHVVAGATSLTVTLDDGHQLAAVVVAVDSDHDLAVVKVNAAGLIPVRLGDSDGVQVGQLAIAIGSPLGTISDSVTQGIVSGTDRTITIGDRSLRTERNLTGLIQTDAAINPGNSGGPLLDVGGSVVGIVTASASNSDDVGFAIPINQAADLLARAAV
jgi:S1-C subfamily serine protease